MKAVIMAGGKGNRLGPLTFNIPKPMVPVLNKPVMSYGVELLKKHNITDIAVTLHYLPEVIKEYFGDGSESGVNFKYFFENTPLGSAGGVKNAEAYFDETFFVFSGDVIIDCDLTKALEAHKHNGGLVTIITSIVQNPLEYGLVMCDKDNRILRFMEKPSWGDVFSDVVNTGVYIVEPEIFQYYEKGCYCDFSRDVFPALLAAGKPLYSHVTTGYWSDIGSFEQYRRTNFDLMDGLLQAGIVGRQVEDGIWVGEGTILPPGVIIEKPVYIGKNCTIEAGAVIGKGTVLGDGNVIGSGCKLKRSILWNHNLVDSKAELIGTTVCSHVKIGANAVLFEGTMVGDKINIGKNVVVKPQVKIWPNKEVPDNSILNMSLIWGATNRKQLFSTLGVLGVVNSDISPEMMAKLAVAHGSTLAEGGQVVIGTDHYRTSQATKKAFMAGLMATGINVNDIGIATTPITRYAVKSLGAAAGLHIRMLPPFDSSRILIEFLDQNGINISKDFEREIEKVYTQENFRRTDIKDFGEIRYAPQLADAYRAGLLKTVNSDMVKRCHFKLLIAYDYLNLGWFIPPLAEKLGCRVTTINSADFSLTDVMGLMRTSQIDMGVFLNSNADDVILFTPAGEIVRDERLITLWSYIAMEQMAEKEIGIPVTASSVIEKIAEMKGGKVVRTKGCPRAVMEVPREDMFQPLFDGTYMFLKVLEFLQIKCSDLNSILDDIPETFMSRKQVECPFADKGTVMRGLAEGSQEDRVEFTEGVKIYANGGWVLVIPDSEEPVVNIICEASSFEAAESLASDYRRKIDKLKTVI